MRQNQSTLIGPDGLTVKARWILLNWLHDCEAEITEEHRKRFRDDILSGRIKLSEFRNCGPKTEDFLFKWCGLPRREVTALITEIFALRPNQEEQQLIMDALRRLQTTNAPTPTKE